MKQLKHLLSILILGFAFHMPSLMAQDSEMGLAKLSAADEKRYREIIEKPIDSGALNTTRINAHKEKGNAYLMLGEAAGREENLVAWAQIDIAGKWGLRSYLSPMGRYEEAIKIGNEIISEGKFVNGQVRIRAYMAQDYLVTNQISKAKEMLDKAEARKEIQRRLVIMDSLGLIRKPKNSKATKSNLCRS